MTNPEKAPSITALRSKALIIAWRTPASLSGSLWLLSAATSLRGVTPTTALKRATFWNSPNSSGAAKFGNASMSPARSAAAWACGSPMKRMVTLASFGTPGCQYSGFLTRSTRSPRRHSLNLNGPVPIGEVLLVLTVLGSIMTASPYAGQ